MRPLMPTVTVLTLLAFASGAAGQSATPADSLTMSLPSGPVNIALGMTHDIPFEVGLAFENVVCPQDGNATVEYAVKDIPSPLPGVKATVAAPATFKVPTGAYTSASPFQGKAASTLRIEVGTDAPANHMHMFQVTASFSGNINGCSPIGGSLPAAQVTGNHSIVTGAGNGSAPSTAPGAPGSNNGPPASNQPSTTSATPAAGAKNTPLGIEPIVVALAVSILVLRRKRPHR